MYKKFISAFHLLNILLQSLYSLALPIGIGALASYLLTRYTEIGEWIWAVLLIIGTLLGLYSMVKYLLSALKNLERLEKQREASQAEKEEKESRQAALREAVKMTEEKNDE